MKHFSEPLSLLLIIILAGCSPRIDVSLGWYYWRTDVRFDENDRILFSSFGTERLYVRFFDVTYDTGTRAAVPTAPANIRSLPGTNCCIVPVVFITVDALTHADAPSLARAVVSRVRAMADDAGFRSRIDEIQLDSDWTAKTRDTYFAMLREVKRLGIGSTAVTVSSTIRLHQVKYRKSMGAPPADRLMLMLYNVHSPRDFTAANAIYDASAERYLRYLPDYPIALDIAVPVYAQCRQYGSRSNFIRLMNDVRARDIPAGDVVMLAPHRYRTVNDTLLSGHRVMKNDILAVDETDLDAALSIVRTCRRYGQRTGKLSERIVLYHYDRYARRLSSAAIVSFTNDVRRQ
ncbi:MAG: hypothetical protein AABZ39_12945 [Spirochaetota bacterium]